MPPNGHTLQPADHDPFQQGTQSAIVSDRNRVGGSSLHLVRKITVFLCVLLLFDAESARASPIKSDENIIFFPTAARWSADLSRWIVPIHAWVFEHEHDSLWRRGALELMARRLDLDDNAKLQTFKERAHWFLVDNQRGKWLQVNALDGSEPLDSTEPLGPTQPNGHLRAELRLEPQAGTAATSSFWLSYAAVLPAGDDRSFRGESLMVAPEGLSVISDIDDTIKITEVADQEALLANTFLKPFEAAPGMADAYQRLAAAQAVFHYVSSSPWQLFPLLSDFMEASAFPRGSFHLRNFRLKDETLLNVLKSAHETKPPIIEELLRAYPKREFVLIGDSGEADPEIYGDIARRHPDRIRHIYVRRVTSETRQNARYRTAFASLPESLWTLFEDAAVISP